MKIYLLLFIQDLDIKEEIMNYNINFIFIKTGLTIKITDLEDQKNIKLEKY